MTASTSPAFTKSPSRGPTRITLPETRSPTLVGADRQHAAAMRALLIQHVEFARQVGCVRVGAEVACLAVRNDMQRVGHYGKGLVSNVHQEWLIAADVVDVVGVAKLLQDLERLRCTPQPERIEADGPHARDSLDSCSRISVALPLLFRGHGILRRPGLSVTRGFVAALDNLFRERWVLFDSGAHHVGSHLYLAAGDYGQPPRAGFLETVLVPFGSGNVRVFGVYLRQRALGSALGLSAGFHLHRDRDD